MIITENTLRKIIRQQLHEGFFDTVAYKAKNLVGALPDYFSQLNIPELKDVEWIMTDVARCASDAYRQMYDVDSPNFLANEVEHEHYLIKWLEMLIKSMSNMQSLTFKGSKEYVFRVKSMLEWKIKQDPSLNVYKNNYQMKDNDKLKYSILYWLIEFYKAYFSLTVHQRDQLERAFYISYIRPSSSKYNPGPVSTQHQYVKVFGYPSSGILYLDDKLPTITSEEVLNSAREKAKFKRDAALKEKAAQEEKRRQMRDAERAEAEEKRMADRPYTAPNYSQKIDNSVKYTGSNEKYDPIADRYYGGPKTSEPRRSPFETQKGPAEWERWPTRSKID